ncbi:MAG: corrinoid protein [Firmicutes bacterium]|nr:corrinoid protein [Bacillota bacterium]
MDSTAILEGLIQSVIQGDEDSAGARVREALTAGMDKAAILEYGLSEAMNRLGRMWEDGEVFLPEVLLSARVFQACADALEAAGGEAKAPVGRCMLGTVRGDLHDLGKNIVGIMMKTAGFEVIDLGRDVTREAFVEAVKHHNPDVLGLSALLTTTMGEQRTVIECLVKEGLRNGVKVMVGGAPVSQRWASEIGADAYAANAQEAVEKARQMLGVR